MDTSSVVKSWICSKKVQLFGEFQPKTAVLGTDLNEYFTFTCTSMHTLRALLQPISR
jgi:hypothetical protein